MVEGKWLVKGGANQTIYLSGKARYAKLVSLDQWGKWSCCLYPDQDSQAKIHKLISEGVKNKLSHDEEGYRITFSRPAVIKTKTRGDIPLDPVEVTDADDYVMQDKMIPDGEDITMKLETYGGKSPSGYGTYKAARLAGIKRHGMKSSRPIPV